MQQSIRYAAAAVRDLDKQEPVVGEQIRSELAAVGHTPGSARCRKLKGNSGLHAARVGPGKRYRAIYLKAQDAVTILMVGDRKDIYRRVNA
jgi:mRNA-degrading endonuclease RelE of RelBE toxin-antitoxin system